MRRFAGLLFLIACLVGLSACPRSAPDYFAFRRDGFRAEVRGTLGEVEFCAQVEVDPLGDGWSVCVEYLAPIELEHTEIRAICNRDGEGIGEAEILRGESRFSISSDTLQGLLMPATAWVSCDEIAAIQKNGEGYAVSLTNGVCLQMREDGRPTRVASEGIQMEIVWLEKAAS